MGERKVKGEKVRNIGKGKGDGGLKGRPSRMGAKEANRRKEKWRFPT